MSVSGIESIGGFQPYVAPTYTPAAGSSAASGTSGVSGTSATSGPSFGDLLTDGIDRLEAVQDKADNLAVQAATGDLNDIHDYTVAATEASVSTQLTVAVRNRALESFNEIMRMPIG